MWSLSRDPCGGRRGAGLCYEWPHKSSCCTEALVRRVADSHGHTSMLFLLGCVDWTITTVVRLWNVFFYFVDGQGGGGTVTSNPNNAKQRYIHIHTNMYIYVYNVHNWKFEAWKWHQVRPRRASDTVILVCSGGGCIGWWLLVNLNLVLD